MPFLSRRSGYSAPMETRSLRPGEHILALAFIGMGLLHFVRPPFFDQAVPPATPMTPRQATLISGVAEVAGGVGLLIPQTRPAARWGLIGLLLAVYPANIYMAQQPEKFGAPRWLMWARLPFQPLLVWLVYRAGRSKK